MQGLCLSWYDASNNQSSKEYDRVDPMVYFMIMKEVIEINYCLFICNSYYMSLSLIFILSLYKITRF